MDTLPKENKMGTMPVNRLLITMSLPMIISMLVQALYNVVDTIFVSMISSTSTEVTAVSLAFPAQNLMIGVATGTAVGVNALLSRSLGRRDRKTAETVAHNGIFLSIISFLVFLLFAIFGARPFMDFMATNSKQAELGAEYLAICCGCSIGLFGQIIFERIMQSTGRTIYTLFTQGTGAIINIILDYIFVIKFSWGVAGAAWATVIGQCIAFIMAILFNRYKNPDVTVSFKQIKPNGRIIGSIYAIGVPSIIMVCIGSVMNLFLNKILGRFTAVVSAEETIGSVEMAVFGIYFKIQSFVFMPIFGMNNGLIPIISYNYGAGNRHRMMKTMKLGMIYAVSIMIVGLAIVQIIPKELLSMFNANDELLSLGIPALRRISLCFVFAGLCIAIGSIFQSLGKSIFSMLVAIARQLVVLVPVFWVLSYTVDKSTTDPSVVWWAFPIAEIASLAATLVFFSYVYRKIIKNIPDGRN